MPLDPEQIANGGNYLPGGPPITGPTGGYPPPAYSFGGQYFNAVGDEVNADGSPIGSKSTGITYSPRETDVDGSITGYPGATFQRASNGNITNVVRPSSGGGGGGGSTNPTNVYISQNPGNLYRTITSDGSDGFPAGTVYQVNGVTGDINIQYRPPAAGNYNNPLDKNNDGLNDSTGWANGVFKDSSSPSGFYYASNGQYIPVTPDGAPYNGPDLSGGGANAKTWTGQGPKGYGTYYLDGANGTPGTFIGDTRAPSTAASSGTPRISSGSSGSGSSGSSAALSAQISAEAAAARQAADQAFQQQQAADGRLYSAQQADLDRRLRAAEDAAQNEKDRAAIQNQRAQLALQATQQFQQAVSSTDPIAFAAFLAANGNISNGLANGQTALSDRALVPAANILQLLNSGMGLQDIPTHDANYYLNQGGTGTTNTGGGGLPTGGTGTTGGTGDTTGAGGATGAGGLPTGGSSGGSPQVTLTRNPEPVYGQRVLGSSPSGGWEIDPTTGLPAIDPTTGQQIWNPNLGASMPTVTGGAGGFGNFDLGQQIGQPQTVQQRNNIANTAMGTYEQGTLGDQRAIGINTAQLQNALGTSQPGPAYPQITPAAYNTVNTAPAGVSGALGVANGTHIDVTTGRLVPNQPVPQATAPAVARMADGGRIGGLPTGHLIPTIVGDRHDNKVSGTEELALLPPGAHVLSHEDTKRALGGTTGLQRALKGGLPRADTGFSLDPSQLAYLQSVYGTPTQPVAPQDPYGYGYTSTYTAPSPVPAPAGYVVQQYPNEQGHYETQYIGGYPTNVWVANPNYNAGLNQYGQPIQAAPQPAPAPVQQPSGGTVSPVPTPPPASTPTTATGGLPTSTTTTTSSSTTPLNTTPGPTVTTPSGTTTQLPSPPPVPTTNTTGGGLPTGTPPTTATTPPLTGTAQNAVNTLPSQYTSGNLVTPDNQAYVDYVRNLRTGVQYPNLNMYSVDYAGIDPTVRDIYEKGLQDQFGIPQSSSQFEQQKYQLRGLPTGAASVTY